MTDPRPDQTQYSTLEVAPLQAHSSYYTHGDEYLPEVTNASPIPSQPEVVSASSDGIADGGYTYVPSENPQEKLQQPPVQAQTSASRWCGVSRKALWILIVVAVILVAGLAGGLAGGLASRHTTASATSAISENSTSGTDTGVNDTVGTSTNPLHNSHLAALNWTDTSDVERRTVFYMYNQSLFFSDYSASNSSWATYNLSNIFAQNGSAIHFLNTTSISVASPAKEDLDYLESLTSLSHFYITVYVLDSGSYLRELVTRDINLLTWTEGALTTAAIQAVESTSLAAVAFFCPNNGASWLCNDQISLLYQNTDGELILNTGPEWTVDVQQLDTVGLGASLAISPFASSSGKNLTDVSELRILYISDTYVKLILQNLNGLSLQGAKVSSLEGSTTRNVEIVASPADYHSKLIVIAVDGSGKYTGTLNTNDAWGTTQKITFTNEDGTNTKSQPSVYLEHIAMDNNGVFYGVSANDSSTIVSYSWTVSNPYVLSWKENIKID